jgi:enoyl-CoA hydratase
MKSAIMSTADVKVFIDGQVATIEFEPSGNKPPTLDLEVLDKLAKCLDEVKRIQARVVFVKSASERFFCVGANIDALKDIDESTIAHWVIRGHEVFRQLEDLPMPVVAVIKGYAMGGGLELALACDLIFSSNTAILAQSEAMLGFIPGWGGTHRLRARLGAAKAKYYFYTGKMLSAEESAKLGLVDFVGDDFALDAELQSFTHALVSNNSNAISQFKKILNDQQSKARDENANIEATHSLSCLQDPDTKKRLHDFLNKKGK